MLAYAKRCALLPSLAPPGNVVFPCAVTSLSLSLSLFVRSIQRRFFRERTNERRLGNLGGTSRDAARLRDAEGGEGFAPPCAQGCIIRVQRNLSACEARRGQETCPPDWLSPF